MTAVRCRCRWRGTRGWQMGRCESGNSLFIGPGIGIHLPALDEDISVDGLLRGLLLVKTPSPFQAVARRATRPANPALQPASRARKLESKLQKRAPRARG